MALRCKIGIHHWVKIGRFGEFKICDICLKGRQNTESLFVAKLLAITQKQRMWDNYTDEEQALLIRFQPDLAEATRRGGQDERTEESDRPA